jgi:hypothetical protein
MILSFTGLSFPAKISSFGCTSKYSKFILQNTLCQILTGGHCENNDLNKQNANVEVVHCLCDKFENSYSVELENEIVKICKEALECKLIIELYSSGDLIEICYNSRLPCPKGNDTEAKYICRNKDSFLIKHFII